MRSAPKTPRPRKTAHGSFHAASVAPVTSKTAPAPALVMSSRLANTNRAPINLRPCPKITRQEVNGHRFYKVDGHNELFPSVTTVLGAAFI